MNKYLQVETRDGPVLCDSVFLAVGECNYGSIGSPKKQNKGTTEKMRKLVEMMQKKEDTHEGQRGRMAPHILAGGSHPRP